MVRRVWRFLLPADHGISGLLCHCLVARSPWFIFLSYTYDYLYFILLSFQIVSSFVRDSSYHDMYYKGCGLLCAHKKSFNTAIPVRSLGPYMCVHYCTYSSIYLSLSFDFIFWLLIFCEDCFKKIHIKDFAFLFSLFLANEISLAPWCDVCGGSSSLLTTVLVAYYVTVLSPGLHGLYFYHIPMIIYILYYLVFK